MLDYDFLSKCIDRFLESDITLNNVREEKMKELAWKMLCREWKDEIMDKISYDKLVGRREELRELLGKASLPRHVLSINDELVVIRNKLKEAHRLEYGNRNNRTNS